MKRGALLADADELDRLQATYVGCIDESVRCRDCVTAIIAHKAPVTAVTKLPAVRTMARRGSAAMTSDLDPDVRLNLVMDRPYTKSIPPLRPSNRFMQSSPMRRNSLVDVRTSVMTQQDIAKRKEEKKTKKRGLLTRVIYEEHLRDVINRVTRTTYSFKMKRTHLLEPRETYYCRPDIWPEAGI